jgi:hypothetical protein
MVKMAATCIGSAIKAYGVSLDYSVASLDGLESVLDEMHREHLDRPISVEGMYARCIGLGAYVGEVLRKAVGGGTWQRNSEYGENTFPLILPITGSIFPTSWCRKRIENGEGDNVAFKAKLALSITQGKGPFGKGASGDE